MSTSKMLEKVLLPGRIRIKDGYYHLIIDTKHPSTKAIIRHSTSTRLKASESKKNKVDSNLIAAQKLLTEFQIKWTKFYFYENKNHIYFTDYMRNWLDSVKSHLEYSTYINYYRIIENRIIPFFESKNISLEDLKAQDIQEFYTYCLDILRLNPNTVIRYHANIRKALESALKKGLVENNQASLVDKPRKKPYIAKIISPHDLQFVLQSIAKTELEVPVFLAAFYGLRRSEVLGLLWSNVNFENSTITVGNTLVEVENKKVVNRKNMKNKTSFRTLPLIPEVATFLKKHQQAQANYQKEFKGDYNKQFLDNICVKKNGDIIKPEFVTKKFKTISQKLGYKDIHFHCLRHSFATNTYNAGMDMKTLQAWLGHSSITTTMDTYTHLLDKRVQESVSIVGGVMKCKNKKKKKIKNHIY